jgi:hypothetical protein
MQLSALSMLISNFTCELELNEDEALVARLASLMFENARSWVSAVDLSGKNRRITKHDQLHWLQLYQSLFGGRSHTELKTGQDNLAQWYRFTQDKKRVLACFRSLRRLQDGLPITSEARQEILEQCKLIGPLIRELAATAHFWEGQQDDD